MHRDRTYVILGASGGIGSAVSRRLASEGARLVLAARSQERIETLSKEIGAEPFVLGSAGVEDIQGAVDHAVETHDRLDGIVNCIGSLLLKPAHLTSEEEWSDVLSTNLGSAFAAVRAATRVWKREGGSIVLIASAAASLGLANHEAIAAAKAGVIGLARSAAATYARTGTRVNVVAPGLVRTPLTERIVDNPAAEKASRELHALRGLGEPEDIASAIAWLLDGEQSWVTGQVLGVDGGLATLKTRSSSS